MSTLVMDGVIFRRWTPKKEEDLETLVKVQAKQIFGEDSEYFDIKHRIESKAGTVSIPDGYVVTFMGKPQCHVVEVELASHSPYDHAIPQLTKFRSALANVETRNRIASELHHEITTDPVRTEAFKAKIPGYEIYRFLYELLNGPLSYIIIIDDVTPEWQETKLDWIKFVEFKTYVREKVGLEVRCHVFTPLFEAKVEPFEGPVKPPIEPVPEWMKRRLRVWKRVWNKGGVISREQLHSIASEVGLDNRGLGGFFVGNRRSLIKLPDGRIQLSEAAVEAVKKYGEQVD